MRHLNVQPRELSLLIPLNLHFFQESSGEKTEKATPKKKSKAREEGQVAKSQEVSTGFILLGGFLALRMFAGGILNGMLGLFSYHYTWIADTGEIFELVYLSRHLTWVFGQILLMT